MSTIIPQTIDSSVGIHYKELWKLYYDNKVENARQRACNLIYEHWHDTVQPDNTAWPPRSKEQIRNYCSYWFPKHVYPANKIASKPKPTLFMDSPQTLQQQAYTGFNNMLIFEKDILAQREGTRKDLLKLLHEDEVTNQELFKKQTTLYGAMISCISPTKAPAPPALDETQSPGTPSRKRSWEMDERENKRVRRIDSRGTPDRLDHTKSVPLNDDEILTSQVLGFIVDKERLPSLDVVNGYDDIKTNAIQHVLAPTLMNNDPRNLLLFGPPGTGKTLLSQTFGQLFETVFKVDSSMGSKYKSETEKLFKKLFEVAKKMAPSLIIFDEAEHIFKDRSDIQHNSTAENSILLNAMTDIVAQKSNICIVACTNLPWIMDAAFLSRFTVKLCVPLPSKKNLTSLLDSYLRKQETKYKSVKFNFKSEDVINLMVEKRFSCRDLIHVVDQIYHNAVKRVDSLASKPALEQFYALRAGIWTVPKELDVELNYEDFAKVISEVKAFATEDLIMRHKQFEDGGV